MKDLKSCLGCLGLLFFFSLGYPPIAFGLVLIAIIIFFASKLDDNTPTYNSTTSKYIENNYSTNSYSNTSYANRPYQTQKNKVETKFYSVDSEINLFGYELKSPFIYVSDSKHTDLAFLISTKDIPNFTGSDTRELGYWPNYSQLNSVQKGKYIKWLASGKNDPNIDLGYVYIYYYGLEYRALIEKQDIKTILFEVINLVSKYNRLRYGFDLIAYLILKNNFNDEEKVKLLQFIKNNSQHYLYNECTNAIIKKLSPNNFEEKLKFAPYQFMTGNETYSLSDRKTELLDFYFKEYLKITPIAQQYTVKQQKYSYYIAMGYGYHNDNQVSYECMVPSQQAKQVWNKGRKALKNLKITIKKFDNSGSELTDIEKYVYLPEVLRKDIISLNETIRLEDESIKTIAELIKSFDLPIPENITQRQSEFIAEACEAFGYCIEPDARYIQKAYKKDSKVIIFEKKFKNIDVNLQTYIVPSFLLDLGFKIALEDEELLEIEIEYIMNFIFGKFPLNQLERQRLQYRAKLIKETTDVGTTDLIKKLLEKSTSDSLDMICKFLVSVAAADGIIKSKEFCLLKKCFSQLGLAEEYLNNLLSVLSISDDPIVIQKASEPRKKGSKIPKQEMEPKEEIKFVLNKEKVSNILIDTSQVQKTLNEIFTDESVHAPTDAHLEEDNTETSVETEGNLEPAYFNILKIIIEKPQWSSRELMTLVQNVGLMLNSTIDKINEWSDEEYGDFLIEEEDNLYLINQEILTIINKNKGELEWKK